MAFGNLVNKTTTETTQAAPVAIKKPTLGGLKPPTAATGTTTVPKLGGLKLPGAVKPAIVKPVTEETPVPVAPEVETLTDEKVEEVVATAVEQTETTEEVVVKEEVKEETKETAEEEVVEEVTEKVAEKATEEVVPETAPEAEIIKETLDPPAADTEKAAAKRKASTPKKTTAKEAKSESEGGLTKEEFEVMEAEMNFCAFDEEFEERKEQLIEMANAIEIPSDVTPAQVINLISELDTLNREVWVEYFELKTRFTNLTALKPEGKIERIKRINRVGKNDTDRERNGLVACQSYNTAADVTVDLLAYQDVLRYRYNFFQSIFDYIATKRQMLITVQACLKTESNL